MDYFYGLNVAMFAMSIIASTYSLRIVSKSKTRLNPPRRATSSTFGDASVIQTREQEFVWTGKDAVNRLFDNCRFKLPPTQLNEHFKDWLRVTVPKKMKTDKEFLNKVIIRNLRKTHSDKLHKIESLERQARHEYNRTLNSIRIHELEKSIHGSVLALQNMRKFVETTVINSTDNMQISADITNSTNLSDRILRVRDLIPLKEIETASQKKELELLKQRTPEYFILQEAIRHMNEYHEEIGLNSATSLLKTEQFDAGKGRNDRGLSFENAAEQVVYRHLLPSLAARENISITDILVVRNIKLGMSSQKGSTAEIDCLICVRAPRPASITQYWSCDFCRVLAVVEVESSHETYTHARHDTLFFIS